MPGARTGKRLGGHLVAESLRALGAEMVFGVPGVHALPIWEGLAVSGLRSLALRQEVNAGFAADGGYGILREYQDAAGFGHAAVDLEQPDLVAVCDSARIPARHTDPERLADDLRRALGVAGPAAVILPVRLAMTQPTP